MQTSVQCSYGSVLLSPCCLLVLLCYYLGWRVTEWGHTTLAACCSITTCSRCRTTSATWWSGCGRSKFILTRQYTQFTSKREQQWTSASNLHALSVASWWWWWMTTRFEIAVFCYAGSSGIGMVLMFAFEMFLKVFCSVVIEFNCFVATGLRDQVPEWMVSVFLDFHASTLLGWG